MEIGRRFCVVTLGITVVLFTSAAQAQQPPDTVESSAAAPQSPESGSSDGFVDNAKRWAEKHQIIERLNGDVDGWYPRLGGMTRGGGFALGPGYRTHVFGDRVLLDLSAGISTKTYKAVDARARWLQAFDERVELWTDFRYEDFPQEDFFGLGLDSSLGNRTSYDFESTDISVRGLVKPTTWSRVGTTIGWMRPGVEGGSDPDYPSIEEIFTDLDAPGLAEQPDYIHTTFFGEIDYRDQRGNPRRGGFYRLSYGIIDDRTLQQFDHQRLDGEAVQYVPLVASKMHVVSGRVGFSYVNNELGERVPFYFLAYVGGVDTVRSFREFRFKDENALWMSLEYRWSPIKWVSLATFVDAGEVRADWENIDLSGLKTGYGFGFRVHSTKQTFARVDFATGGGEGWQMFLKLGPSF
jgi:outer membrane protein assembly factor BamA